MQFSGGCVLRAVLTSRQKKSAQVSVSSARAFNAAEIEKCFYDVFLYKYRGLIYNKIVAINEQIYNFA